MKATMKRQLSHRPSTGVKSTPTGYRGPVRRLLSFLVRAVLVLAVVGLVRAVLLDRAPRRELNGDQPLIGSLDTWPDVPHKPQG